MSMLALPVFFAQASRERKNSNEALENPSSLMRRNFHEISSNQLCVLSVAYSDR
jgi:hypothetical protein